MRLTGKSRRRQISWRAEGGPGRSIRRAKRSRQSALRLFYIYRKRFAVDCVKLSRMKISTVFALSVAILSSGTVMRASVPIIVATPARMRAAMKLVTDAQDQLQNGDVARARRNVDAALHNDPTFWQRCTCGRRF